MATDDLFHAEWSVYAQDFRAFGVLMTWDETEVRLGQFHGHTTTLRRDEDLRDLLDEALDGLAFLASIGALEKGNDPAHTGSL